MSASRTTLRTLALIAALCVSACSQGWRGFEHDTLNPGTEGPGKPWDADVPHERIQIPSNGRILDAVKVTAPETCQAPRPAVLIFHGRGESVGDWAQAQKRLHDRCVSSLVFDYTGHGASSPGGDIARLNEDAAAAATYFATAFGDAQPRCLLSHSMGASPLLDAATRDPSVTCIVLASPFSSLKDMAIAGGLPRPVSWLLSDPWNNVRAASRTRARLLWVHSREDATIPIALGRRVFEAAAGEKLSVTVRGFDHNAIYARTPDPIWDPILDFLRPPAGGSTPQSAGGAR